MIAYMIVCMLYIPVLSYPNVRNSLIELIEISPTLQPIGKIIDIVRKEGLYDELPLLWPIKGKYRVSSNYGYRYHPLTGLRKFHSGVDVAVELATPVYAAGSGTVIFAGRKGGYGRCIIIQHQYGFTSFYGHLSAYYTTAGKEIKQGQAIGFVGNTGESTGNHLHFEIRKNNKAINPIWYNGYEK